MYAQAGHCYEELLLHQPHSIALHVQYADVLYTMGGSGGHNFGLAQSHYAAAVKLSEGRNARALYGLCACAAQLSTVKVGLELCLRAARHTQGWHGSDLLPSLSDTQASCAAGLRGQEQRGASRASSEAAAEAVQAAQPADGWPHPATSRSAGLADTEVMTLRLVCFVTGRTLFRS